MTIETQEDVEALRRIGKIVHNILNEMLGAVCPGISTKELDKIAERRFEELGAYSAPKSCYDFPGFTCISVNNEAAHGIPSDRVLKNGDLVNIDVSAEMDGYFADTGASTSVGTPNPTVKNLLDTTQKALKQALFTARAGMPISSVGKKVETIANKAGLMVVENIGGHGVGRNIHEEPRIVNYFDKHNKEVFKKGQVVAIEPILSTNANYCEEEDDGWTLAVPEGGLVAQFEHSIIITDSAPIILT